MSSDPKEGSESQEERGEIIDIDDTAEAQVERRDLSDDLEDREVAPQLEPQDAHLDPGEENASPKPRHENDLQNLQLDPEHSKPDSSSSIDKVREVLLKRILSLRETEKRVSDLLEPVAGPSKRPKVPALEMGGLPLFADSSSSISSPNLALLQSETFRSPLHAGCLPNPRPSVIFEQALPPAWANRTGGKEVTSSVTILERSRRDPSVRQVFFKHETGKIKRFFKQNVLLYIYVTFKVSSSTTRPKYTT